MGVAERAMESMLFFNSLTRSLPDSETLFFVNDKQSHSLNTISFRKSYGFRQECQSSLETFLDLSFSFLEPSVRGGLSSPKMPEALDKRVVVLLRQNCSPSKKSDLFARHHA
jgi:hypothetical protein